MNKLISILVLLILCCSCLIAQDSLSPFAQEDPKTTISGPYVETRLNTNYVYYLIDYTYYIQSEMGVRKMHTTFKQYTDSWPDINPSLEETKESTSSAATSQEALQGIVTQAQRSQALSQSMIRQQKEKIRQEVQRAIEDLRSNPDPMANVQMALERRLNSLPNAATIVIESKRSPQEDDSFKKRQEEEHNSFRSSLASNISQPEFDSKITGQKISFDLNDPDDKKAFDVYADARMRKFSEAIEGESYAEAQYSQEVIEVRQSTHKGLSREESGVLIQLAKGVFENNTDFVFKAMDFLLSLDEFSSGFAASIANNLNPASFLYPIAPQCSTEWCKIGEYIGDATSTLIGAYETFKGMTLTVSGSALTFATVAAVPATGGASLVASPASAGLAIAGIAIAGHGVDTMNKSFQNIYRKLDTPENISKVKQSQKLSEDTGFKIQHKRELNKNSSYETIKEFYRTLKNTNLTSKKKKSFIRSFQLDKISYEITTKDMHVYRWHNNGDGAEQLGFFVSPVKNTDPAQARLLLDLPETNKTLILDTYTLQAGTKIFKGPVHASSPLKGNGIQYYIGVEDEKVLSKVLIPHIFK